MYEGFTTFVVVSGLTMIITYSLSYPWWRSGLGRMMITYASAEIAMSAILCSSIVFRYGPEWFRGLWFGLQAIVGLTFCAQTTAIIRLRRARGRAERTAGEGTTDHVLGSTDTADH
jgi:hypothetical protein